MLLAQYLAELKKIRLLEPGEEQAFWQGCKEQGDLQCRRRLIESYQPLVFKVAMTFRGKEETVMDSIQEGTVGLIEAVESFDHTRGVAFSLYATHRIRGRILTYLEREGQRQQAYFDAPAAGQENELAFANHIIDTALPVASQVEQSVAMEQVKKAFERLPANEQAVLTGVYMEDCEPKQLAADLDLSVSHIYRLQKQGIRRVRGMLSKFMQHW